MRFAKMTAVAAFALAAAACNTEADADVSTDVNLAEDAAANDVLGGDQAGNADRPRQ